MRKQNGCIRTHGNNWCVLWREGNPRKLQSKVIREITSEDRKNRDRKGKLRQPRDVQDAARAHMDVVNRAAGNPGRPPSLLKIGELVEQHYFPDIEKGLKIASVENYKFNWEKYLKAKVANCIVRDFHKQDAFLLWDAIHRENPHLRRRTMLQIKSVLHNVFKWAGDRGMFDGDRVNPATASLPSGLPANKATEAYNIEEVSAILKASIDPKFSAVIALLFGSGCRKGEIAGLTWENYERRDDGAILQVRQAVWHGKIQSPKTQQSIGDINLGEAFCTYVDAYRASLPAGADSGLIFPGRFPNQPMDMSSYAFWKLIPFLKTLKIPWRGYHAFRRGNSTFVAKAFNSETAAALSRHTPEMAEAHYIKANDQERRGAKAAKVATIQSKRAQMRETAAAALSNAMESRQVQ